MLSIYASAFPFSEFDRKVTLKISPHLKEKWEYCNLAHVTWLYIDLFLNENPTRSNLPQKPTNQTINQRNKQTSVNPKLIMLSSQRWKVSNSNDFVIWLLNGIYSNGNCLQSSIDLGTISNPRHQHLPSKFWKVDGHLKDGEDCFY